MDKNNLKENNLNGSVMCLFAQLANATNYEKEKLEGEKDGHVKSSCTIVDNMTCKINLLNERDEKKVNCSNLANEEIR